MEKVGTIFVDAGCVMVGDPCYTQGADASSASASWNEFLHKTWPNVFLADGGINHDERMEDVAQALGEEGVGFVVSSGYGDGEYPVYVERDSAGHIASLTVVFVDESDSDPYEDDLEDEEDIWSDPDEDESEYDDPSAESELLD